MTTATKPAAGAKTPKYELLTNVPVVIDIKYVDVWPDRNGYGSQVSLKGKIDGEVMQIFLKGQSWANLKALKEAGVIGPYSEADENPTETKANLMVLNGNRIQLTRKQVPGQKYLDLEVVNPAQKPGASAPVSAPAKAKPEGRDIGRIPELDDLGGDEPPPVEEAYAEAPAAESEKGAALYAKITDYTIKSILPKYAAAGIPVSMEGTAAIVATLYIQANR